MLCKFKKLLRTWGMILFSLVVNSVVIGILVSLVIILFAALAGIVDKI